MSLQRRFASQYAHVRYFMNALTLPAWMTGNAMRLGLLAMLLASSTAYIMRMSSSVALGYQVKNLETTVANLTSEQQKLTVQIASFRSMNSIQARLPLLNMVPVAQIKHVTLPSVGEVVMAKK